MRMHELWRGEDGATAVEMAVVLPVFFLMLFGLLGFSMVLFGYANATYASRGAARYASMGSVASLTPANAASVQAFVTPLLVAAPSGGAVISTVWVPSNTVGGTVKVTVSITYPMNLPFFPARQITVSSFDQRTIAR